MKKKKRITGQQIKFIINMVSIAIFAISYLYIYEGYVEKTEKAYVEAEVVKAQIKDRENKLAEEDTVRKDIDTVKEQKQSIIDSFPVYIEKEDNFMFIEQMEESINVKTSSISTTDNTVFYETILPVQELTSANQTSEVEGFDGADTTSSEAAPGDAAPELESTMTAIMNTVSMSFMTNYDGFKKMVEYVKNYPDHTVIDSVAVSVDTTTGTLAGNLILKRFALTGTGKEYEAPSIDGIDIGIDNIFGTGGKKKTNTEATTNLNPVQE